jgi:hypothetical protein
VSRTWIAPPEAIDVYERMGDTTLVQKLRHLRGNGSLAHTHGTSDEQNGHAMWRSVGHALSVDVGWKTKRGDRVIGVDITTSVSLWFDA